MDLANELAAKAFKLNEVPIGCVIVYNNQIIGTGFNSRERKKKDRKENTREGEGLYIEN